MDLNQWLGALGGIMVPAKNWVDWAILLILVLHVLNGIRRGFVGGLVDLLSLPVAFVVALKGYPILGDLLSDSFQLPRVLASVGSFVALICLATMAYFLVVGGAYAVFDRLVRFLHLRWVDRLAGAVPGLAMGLAVTCLLLTLLVVLPLLPTVRTDIMASHWGRPLVDQTLRLEPRLESLLGRADSQTLVFFTRRPQEGPVQMSFPFLGELRVDAAAEARMQMLLNGERTKRGLPALVTDTKLTEVARQHSQEMFQLGYFAHESPVLGSPFDRMRRAGISFQAAGENLALAPMVDIAHVGLMNSPEHVANILRPEFRRVGIGVITDGIHGSMFTQDFTN